MASVVAAEEEEEHSMTNQETTTRDNDRNASETANVKQDDSDPLSESAASTSLLSSSLWQDQSTVVVVLSVGVVLISLFLSSPTTTTTTTWSFSFYSHIVVPTLSFVWRLTSTALGVALGLGCATYVYDQLEHWNNATAAAASSGNKNEEDEDRNNNNKTFSTRGAPSSSLQRRRRLGSSGRSVSFLTSSSWSTPADSLSYAALMTAAGYRVSMDGHCLRGQVVLVENNTDADMCKTNLTTTKTTAPYHYTHVEPPSQQRGPRIMKEHCPQLPEGVSVQLGRWIEHIIRDFVASWYSMIDSSCPYQDEQEYRRQQQQQTNEALPTTTAATSTSLPANNNNTTTTTARHRQMVLSTISSSSIPLIDTMYESLAFVFGELSLRAQHVNVLELVLLQWIKVLSKLLRTYRQLRVLAVTKQQLHPTSSSSSSSSRKGAEEHETRRRNGTSSTTAAGIDSSNTCLDDETGNDTLPNRGSMRQSTMKHSTGRSRSTSGGSGSKRIPSSRQQRQPVTEMSMTKEFLLAGKLHRALTFGMDVPSLLFADPFGNECGSHSTTSNNDSKSEEDVLEDRFFAMLYECELDYNRVLGHRMCRALLPRSEFSSPILRTLMTELMAGCVLTPIMGCFSPDFLNYWISTGASSVEEEEGVASAVLEQPGPGVEMGVEVPLKVRTEESFNATRITPREPETAEEGEGFELRMSQVNFPSMENVGDDSGDEGVSNFGVDESIEPEEKAESVEPQDSGDLVLPLLTMSVIELQRFMDFEECRDARKRQEQTEINWNEPGCREAILSLVLVIEAALLHGRREKRLLSSKQNEMVAEEGTEDLMADETMLDDDTMSPLHSSSLSQLLMEITSDLDAFEAMVEQEEKNIGSGGVNAVEEYDGDEFMGAFKASASELSTLRTLISAWLHTGQTFRTISVLIRARRSILEPFFYDTAFLRSDENASGFVRQLRSLDGVEILVDTSSILGMASLDVSGKTNLAEKLHKPPCGGKVDVSAALEAPYGDGSDLRSNDVETSARLSRFVQNERQESNSSVNLGARMSMAGSLRVVGGSPSPRYLDFHRNRNFASSLRAERERRQLSWESVSRSTDDSSLRIISRLNGSSEEDVAHFRELHHIARVMYSGTNILGLRDGARRNEVVSDDSMNSSARATPVSGGTEQELTRLSLLTVEMAGQRRRLEIPDDDSSFLLRAQPRPLNVIGIHRDQLNHESSYKCFAATYEEPAIRPDSTRYTGGRYIRRCQLRYYPSDRTATIVLLNDPRSLDQRKGHMLPPETITVGGTSASAITGDFLRKRHLCQKWNPRGAAPRSGSILASSVMEPADFNAVPRAGKAVDFVYRTSLFERPTVELSGKLFKVHDSNAAGAHRADASSFELSDASLTVALLEAGRDWEDHPGVEAESIIGDADGGSTRTKVEMGTDGYPVVWMKFNRKLGDKTVVEIKPYRASYVRAALMIASTRQEAQVQCLLQCVRNGSARDATRKRTEGLMRPPLKLLEFATSNQREKEGILLRDLKLGINHIDREQLRRNNLLNPRYPTSLISLKATVEGALSAKSVGTIDGPGSMIVYKIRCVAIVELVETEEDGMELTEYISPDGAMSTMFREEWVVHRPFRDFNILHKHLKTQVSASETSASAGARLVGAATAAFTVNGNAVGNRGRKSLIPSLGQASKAGALGATKKSLQKRRAILDEYLKHLMSPSHPMSQCSELMLFLAANHPLPPEAYTGTGMVNGPDHLGRTDMFRTALDTVAPETHVTLPAATFLTTVEEGTDMSRSNPVPSEQVDASLLSTKSVSTAQSDVDEDDPGAPRVREKFMLPPIKAKIDRVPLSKARNAAFELIRSQFDFESASFFRNRLLSALKTMSFAVTSAAEFRNTLYDAHIKHLSADSVAGWIEYGLSMLWPDGVFMESSPPTTPEESKAMAQSSLEALPSLFPDQVRAIIGQEITQDGLEMLHEMLQNRAVTKSLAYMLFDLLWAEVFPELQDTLSGGEALESA